METSILMVAIPILVQKHKHASMESVLTNASLLNVRKEPNATKESAFQLTHAEMSNAKNGMSALMQSALLSTRAEM